MPVTVVMVALIAATGAVSGTGTGTGTASGSGSGSGSGGEAKDVLAKFADEPDVRVLIDAAVRQAELDPSRLRSFLSRVRAAPWLPQVLVRVDRNDGIDQSLGLGPSGPRQGADAKNATGWLGQASWDLSRLVFDPNELGVARTGLWMMALREEVVDTVVRLYFERRRLQVHELLEPAAAPLPAVERELRIREIEALLDDLTGGALTAGLKRAAPAPK